MNYTTSTILRSASSWWDEMEDVLSIIKRTANDILDNELDH